MLKLIGYKYLADNTNCYVQCLYDENGESIGFIINFIESTTTSIAYYYVKNLLGDIVKLVDATGKEIVSYSYDAWGNMSYNTPTDDDPVDAIIASSFNPFFYRGYYLDLYTCSYYLQSRFYNPKWGRYINADLYCDTETSALGTNMFAFCNNNPVNSVDPSGYWGADVHYGGKYNGFSYDGTYEWAIDVGFNANSADIIADADRLTDKLWHYNTSWLTGQEYHFNRAGKSEEDSRITKMNEFFEKALKLWEEADENYAKTKKYKGYDTALKKLGIGLHALQDISAHGNYGVKEYPAGKKIKEPHGKYFDDVRYDWADSGLIKLVKTKNTNGLGNRYEETKNNSLCYLALFRWAIGHEVPEDLEIVL